MGVTRLDIYKIGEKEKGNTLKVLILLMCKALLYLSIEYTIFAYKWSNPFMTIHEEKNSVQEQEILQEAQEKGKQLAAESLQKDLDSCKQVVTEWQEKCARLGADFENYKKRMAKEQALWIQSARVSLLSSLIAVIDNFDRAMEHKPMTLEAKSWIDGISMIYGSLHDFLKKSGVKEVSYDHFDPTYHEAIVQVDSDKHTTGEIVEVLEKGYRIDDHVLRPAKVSVAK